jgi:succinate dehydrogenase flavin-adding protein (antitoxin of CptAB toxin-antitoxin module)
MDYLLGRFAEQAIDSMNADDIAVLERLIEVPDPQIELAVYEGYSLGEGDLDAMVVHVRRFHGLPEAG